MWKGGLETEHLLCSQSPTVATIIPILKKTDSAENVWSQGPGRGRWSHTDPFPPTDPPRAAPHLAHTATEVSTHIDGWGQLHGGLHTTQVEQRVQVETLALPW